MRAGPACLIAFAVAGCAAATPGVRGQVMMKIDSATSHLRMPENSVRVGDQLRFMRKRCNGSGKLIHCDDSLVGEGTIAELLNSRYSVVRVGNAEVEEGDAVEDLDATVRAGRRP